MSKIGLFIKHTALSGKRDEVHAVWEKHMQPRIAANAGHEAYFYCFDENDPDTIHVYQQYTNREAMQEFLAHPEYADYLKEVGPLIAHPPEMTTTNPIWIKGAKA